MLVLHMLVTARLRFLMTVENLFSLRFKREPPGEMEENGVLVGVLGKHPSGKESCNLEVLQGVWWVFSLFLKFEGVIILWLNVRASLCIFLGMLFI